MTGKLPYLAVIVWSAFFPGAACAQVVASKPDEEARIEFFEKKIRPILVSNCYTCHSASTKASGGLRVDDHRGLLEGGGRGAAVVPGDARASLLLRALKHEADAPKMPPGKKLSDTEIADLARWIAHGADWTPVQVPLSLGVARKKYEKLRKEHWAFQPIRDAKAPPTKDQAWPRTDVDRFLLAKLEEKGLAPVADADRLTLLRRATFDLTGLPPTPAEVDAFLADGSADAFACVVDRLLGSPAFGERWGRHWLDVARYGESTGSSRNLPLPHAWRYRDYVIDAFNKDKPFDQFIREQIAGDLLPAASDVERKEQLVATGFLALGVKDVNQRFKIRFTMDNIDEQIDTVSRAFLGLTVSCARCHDHKYDPIPTTDYYALAGIFKSTDLCAGVKSKMGGGGLDYYEPSLLILLEPGGPIDPETAKRIAHLEKDVAVAKAEFEKLKTTPEGDEPSGDGRPKKAVARQKMNRLAKELTALRDSPSTAHAAFGARESKDIGDTEVRIRGEAEKVGPTVPRGFLSAVDVPGAAKINPRQSGRLELAHWLASPANPLTPRVIANRVWKYLFGQGLVSSVDNFGVTGDVPANPELLDHLASNLIRDGWSIKKLVRSLVLSRAYQLSAEASDSHREIDPGNRLGWRHSPRRLDAEEIRDAMLAVSGKLDRARPHASAAKNLQVVELTNNGVEARSIQDQGQASVHRSVYLPLVRGLTPRSLEVFDFAEQGMVTGARDATTVPPQALYLLNDAFVRRQALTLAERLLADRGAGDDARVEQVYRLALGRKPSPAETERARGYIAEYEVAARGVPQTPPAPVVPKKPAPAKKKGPANPEETDQDNVRAVDSRSAAWASFVHAVLASAEFRYVR